MDTRTSRSPRTLGGWARGQGHEGTDPASLGDLWVGEGQPRSVERNPWAPGKGPGGLWRGQEGSRPGCPCAGRLLPSLQEGGPSSGLRTRTKHVHPMGPHGGHEDSWARCPARLGGAGSVRSSGRLLLDPHMQVNVFENRAGLPTPGHLGTQGQGRGHPSLPATSWEQRALDHWPPSPALPCLARPPAHAWRRVALRGKAQMRAVLPTAPGMLASQGNVASLTPRPQSAIPRPPSPVAYLRRGSGTGKGNATRCPGPRRSPRT